MKIPQFSIPLLPIEADVETKNGCQLFGEIVCYQHSS